MAKNKGLLHAYALDKGSYKKLSWRGIDEWSPEQGLLWIHLDFTIKSAQNWLIKHSGLSRIQSQRMIAEETRPRASIFSNGFLVSLRGVNLNPGQDPEDMVSIRVWIEKHRIITTQRRNLISIKDIKEAIESGNGPRTTFNFFNMLSNRLLDRIGDIVDDIDSQVDTLEEDVISAESHYLRPKIADLRRQSISIKRYLAPQREAFYRLQSEKSELIDDVGRMLIHESNDRIVRYIEDLDESRERAAVTQEELTSRLSEQMDKRIYILSVAAVLFLPLSFITGLLGINVEGIPGSKSQWGFIIVCSILTVILIGFFWLLKRYKWI